MDNPVRTSDKARAFDKAYQGSEMYYGWEVRPEFEDFFGRRNMVGWRALDLGAGEGRYSIYAARRGCTVTAVDFSASGLDKLRDIAGRERLAVVTELCDLASYSFRTGGFDLVIAATILDHLGDRDRNRAIRGIRDSLKPEGILYVNVFTTADPGCSAAIDRTTEPGISDTSFGMAHYFAPGELKDCFSGMSEIYYYEGVEEDLSHGRPHHHGWASLIARKEGC
ncbi:MAG: class I SAM-dependent methyltransferase [Thermodesulfobacteriota bacterium]